MRLDVVLTPGEISQTEVSGRAAVVIDVLRASSCIVEALSAGAKAIYPVGSIDEALRLANTFGRDEVLLTGERRCLRIEGFDLGNSPREYTAERVAGKTLVMTTTNGTHALSLAGGAARVFIGALLNLEAIVEELVRTEADPVLVCSGRERRLALEDAVCAGAMAARLIERRPGAWQLNDGALAALALTERFGIGEDLFARTAAGQAIAEAGLAEDLAFCAQTDRHPLLPVLQNRNITLVAPTAAVSTP
ncbi:MAG TPA: 2-phosphosulfolactate phosphatase [Longimicrobiaceae bacterium]|nr:2-phosphosulfolactate phosphatase [Longimicrobiaceae bacterium]